MKWMLDLNVVLDVLQRREPFYKASARILSLVVKGKASGFLPAHALTTIHSIVTRNLGDFSGSPVSAMTPDELLAALGEA